VTDQAGGVIRGAEVSFKSDSTAIIRTTARNGSITVSLPSDHYFVTVAAGGFEPARITDFSAKGPSVALKVVLRVGASSSPIVVPTEVPVQPARLPWELLPEQNSLRDSGSWYGLPPTQSTISHGHTKRATNLDGIIENIYLAEGVETIGGASIEDVIREVRERTDFPVGLDMLEFEKPKDFVTLGEALAKLHGMQASGTLGTSDQSRLDRYEEMAETREPSEILVPRQRTFSLVQDRVTVRDLLDQLVALDDEYLWKNYGTEMEPIVVIQPRASRVLDWRVPPICEPQPIAIDELLAGCNGRECGPFIKLLGDHSIWVVYMFMGPVSPGEQGPDIRPHGLVDLCNDHLTARDVLNLIAKAAKTSWTVGGIKGMRFISFDPKTRR
jgi:hypothetical protein